MTTKRITAATVNAHIKDLGVKIQNGGGYFYWILAEHDRVALDAASVYVNSADQLTLGQWRELALEVAENNADDINGKETK